MLIGENIMLALNGLLANKMRALLTMLGIIIGIGSVIAIMSVGNSISSSVTSSMEDMGVNNITLGVSQKSTSETSTADGRVFMGFSRGSTMDDEDYITDEMLDAMKEVPEGKRGAKFVSAVCFILPDGRHLTCMGECPGSIAFERLNGDYGFGYDPLFIPADCGVGKRDKRPNTEHRSYAQLTPDEKDAISHRGNALAELEKQLPEFLAEK